MFTPLDKGEVERIHRMSLEILDRAGIEVKSEKALSLFKGRGARVDCEGSRYLVRIPPSLVEDALGEVPRSYVLYGRKHGCEVRFERGNPPLFGPSGVPCIIYDLETGVRRRAGLKDFVSLIKLFDGLENVDFVTTPCTFDDVPSEVTEVSTFFHLVNTTQKPFDMDFSGQTGFKDVLSMVDLLKETVFEGRPFVSFGFCPVISPLRLDTVPTDQLIEAARAGIPVAPITMVQPGLSAPATLAGTLVVMNAEILALLVLAQAARPGTPFLYGTIPGTTNFATGRMLTASPELPLLNAAATQLAGHCGLPNWATAGRTDANLLDIQAGYEHCFAIPWVVLSGATYISAIGGFLESVSALSFEKFVIDDEVVGMTRRVLRGLDTDPEHCAVELVSSMGPGANFLAEDHTIDHMRREFFRPSVSETSDWEDWNQRGRPTALQRARQKAKRIIETHSAPPLPPQVIKQVRDLFPGIVIDLDQAGTRQTGLSD